MSGVAAFIAAAAADERAAGGGVPLSVLDAAAGARSALTAHALSLTQLRQLALAASALAKRAAAATGVAAIARLAAVAGVLGPLIRCAAGDAAAGADVPPDRREATNAALRATSDTLAALASWITSAAATTSPAAAAILASVLPSALIPTMAAVALAAELTPTAWAKLVATTVPVLLTIAAAPALSHAPLAAGGGGNAAASAAGSAPVERAEVLVGTIADALAATLWAHLRHSASSSSSSGSTPGLTTLSVDVDVRSACAGALAIADAVSAALSAARSYAVLSMPTPAVLAARLLASVGVAGGVEAKAEGANASSGGGGDAPSLLALMTTPAGTAASSSSNGDGPAVAASVDATALTISWQLIALALATATRLVTPVAPAAALVHRPSHLSATVTPLAAGGFARAHSCWGGSSVTAASIAAPVEGLLASIHMALDVEALLQLGFAGVHVAAIGRVAASCLQQLCTRLRSQLHAHSSRIAVALHTALVGPAASATTPSPGDVTALAAAARRDAAGAVVATLLTWLAHVGAGAAPAQEARNAITHVVRLALPVLRLRAGPGSAIVVDAAAAGALGGEVSQSAPSAIVAACAVLQSVVASSWWLLSDAMRTAVERCGLEALSPDAHPAARSHLLSAAAAPGGGDSAWGGYGSGSGVDGDGDIMMLERGAAEGAAETAVLWGRVSGGAAGLAGDGSVGGRRVKAKRYHLATAPSATIIVDGSASVSGAAAATGAPLGAAAWEAARRSGSADVTAYPAPLEAHTALQSRHLSGTAVDAGDAHALAALLATCISTPWASGSATPLALELRAAIASAASPARLSGFPLLAAPILHGMSTGMAGGGGPSSVAALAAPPGAAPSAAVIAASRELLEDAPLGENVVAMGAMEVAEGSAAPLPQPAAASDSAHWQAQPVPAVELADAAAAAVPTALDVRDDAAAVVVTGSHSAAGSGGSAGAPPAAIPVAGTDDDDFPDIVTG